MEKRSLQDDYRVLNLEQGCSLLELERAYQKMRALYDFDSLATYALYDDDERQEKLESLKDAYQRLLRQMASRNAPPEGGGEKKGELDPAAPSEIEPLSGNERPGAYLRRLRERSGMTIRDVADRTKIGAFQLESIESECFEKLPAPVYLRGFVQEFARIVGAPDPKDVTSAYVERYRAASALPT